VHCRCLHALTHSLTEQATDLQLTYLLMLQACPPLCLAPTATSDMLSLCVARWARCRVQYGLGSLPAAACCWQLRRHANKGQLDLCRLCGRLQTCAC